MLERFGVTFDWRGASIEAITTIALQADHSGCGYFFVGEAWGLEAFSTVGHVLTITKRIKVGTGVVSIYSRTPATIAMACATLSQLAPGRFLLGIGTSGQGLVEAFHGIKFDKPFKRTREYVDAIRKIQSGEFVDYSGKSQPPRIRLFTTPAIPPIPTYLGAIGEKNLALSGEISDGAIVTMYPISKLVHCRDMVRQGNASKKVFAFIPIKITSNDREESSGKMEVSKLVSFYISSMGKYYAQNLIKLGYEKQVNEIKQAAIAGGTSEAARVISEDFLREFGLVGTASQIIDRLARFPEGVNPILAFNASTAKDGGVAARAIRELSVVLNK
ncbi:MAG: LLM class flavin-dependent oxidoreductase [Nitrososphaerota archaeon]|nr:LLM class flavin-dependent oxidoreductase [Nitrososphaerota archaeon]